MEYAQLTPGHRFAPLHSLLYYGQRLMTPLPLRRAMICLLRGALRLRHGSGVELHTAMPQEDAALVFVEEVAQRGVTAGQPPRRRPVRRNPRLSR